MEGAREVKDTSAMTARGTATHVLSVCEYLFALLTAACLCYSQVCGPQELRTRALDVNLCRCTSLRMAAAHLQDLSEAEAEAAQLDWLPP